MLTQKDLTLIIPSSNNLRHLKNAYASIKTHAPEVTIIILDDASTDGTLQWANSLVDDKIGMVYRTNQRLGHTILYDKGISFAETDAVGIMHADMILGPNYVENLLKHLQRKTVVCATRVEPPLHPPGKEKIVEDFGMDFDSLNIPAFERFCLAAQSEVKDITTKGMFAPWIIYKDDFSSMGGHDAVFAPFPYEDSDIFQRWMLAGYELIQSRDAFVYHLTCRGHRWTEQVGKDDDYFKQVSSKAQRNYLRKWGCWIQNDEYQHPIIKPRYRKYFVVQNCTPEALQMLEPWCDKIYIDQGLISEYVALEQPKTGFKLSDRVLPLATPIPEDGVIVSFDLTRLDNAGFQFITQLTDILQDSLTELGEYEYSIFKITVQDDTDYVQDVTRSVVKNIF